MGSEEYAQRHDAGYITGFLTAIYQDALNRAVDPAGGAAWGQALLSGASRSDVALAILRSPESDTAEAQTLYSQFLGRTADPEGLNHFVQALQAGVTNEQAAVVMCSSNEYLAL